MADAKFEFKTRDEWNGADPKSGIGSLHDRLDDIPPDIGVRLNSHIQVIVVTGYSFPPSLTESIFCCFQMSRFNC